MSHNHFKLQRILFMPIYIFLLFNLSFSQEKDIRPILSWGGIDVPEKQMIGSITDFIISSEEKIVVADIKSHEVLFLDKKGKIVKRIGRKGKGPLEFGAPSSITQLGDSLFIWEIDNNRFQCLTLDGDFKSIHYPRADLGLRYKCFDPRG